MSKLMGLADANNFFVSCERVFRPDLQNKPVVVLSNNDGCIIARSNEVKKMGVPMGAPMFQYEAFCKKHGITVFSGNMALYRDMSSRVLKILRRYSDVVEPYSIDESFFNLAIASLEDPETYCDPSEGWYPGLHWDLHLKDPLQTRLGSGEGRREARSQCQRRVSAESDGRDTPF